MLVVVVGAVLGLALVGGALALRTALGGRGVLMATAVAGAVLVVAALSLVGLVGIDQGGGDTTAADPPAASETDDDVTATRAGPPAGEEAGAVEHDPARLWAGLGLAALLLLVAGVVLRSTDWTPVGPDPWDDDPPGQGRAGSGPAAAPR